MSGQTISAMVGDRARSWAVALPASFSRQWQDAHNDPGSAQLANPGDDSGSASLQRGNVVTFWLGAEPAFSMVIEHRTLTTVAAGEEVDQGPAVTGRGQVVVLEEGIVAPYRNEDVRAFNFANPQLDDSGWTDPVVSAVLPTPQGWPDGFAEWVWDRDPLTLPIPAGDTYWRKWFEVLPGKNLDFWCVADDGYELWLDGKKLFDDTLVGGWTGIPKHQTEYVEPGIHLLAVHARNNNDLLAGMRCTVMEMDSAGTLTNVLIHSDASWSLLAYPADPPGFTPGQVFNLLLAEAQARGGLGDVAVTFTDTHDSAGVPWPTTSDISVPIGTDLLGVLQQLAEGHADFSTSVTSLTLHLHVHRGIDTGVALAPHANITELSFEDS